MHPIEGVDGQPERGVGRPKRFKFPIRTTDEGTAVPTGGFDTDPDLQGPVLFTEPDSLGCDVWTK